MTRSKARKELAALRQIALDDLDEATDAQVRQEAAEDGEDIGAIAGQMRSAMQEAAAAALRHRLVLAKERMRREAPAPRLVRNRPPLEKIKRIILGLPSAGRSPMLAFREGKTQTDGDWESLYDDLVAMGEIKVDDPEH